MSRLHRRAAWATDIHLDMVSEEGARGLCQQVREAEADCLFLTGDIALASNVVAWLELLAAELSLPIYFVLGNHDYYHGSIAAVRAAVRGLSSRSPHLHWLPETGLVRLTDKTGLAGDGGWGDASLGDWEGTSVRINDYRLIEDLVGHSHEELGLQLRKLGAEAAARVSPMISEAAGRFERLVLLTHVPPWIEACWYQGETADDNWAPHFTCGAMGAMLIEAAGRYPDLQLEVFCGHTHSAGFARMAPNLTVRTGKATYGAPGLEDVLGLI